MSPCPPPPSSDPEILERRYPVVLRRFSLRKGSGGAGRFKGGDGVIREVGNAGLLLAELRAVLRACEPIRRLVCDSALAHVFAVRIISCQQHHTLGWRCCNAHCLIAFC
jgi:hypothetical protein